MHAPLSAVEPLLDRFHAIMADGFQPSCEIARAEDAECLRDRFGSTLEQMCLTCGADAEAATEARLAVLARLDALRTILQEDVQAALDQDPSAGSRVEVEICYPGFRAIVAYRLAHELVQLRIPLLPRMIAELAHKETGIDIHPGAQIGRGFFIDHGTGTVIGQTTVIGDGVTLYQGVTLGARNLPRDPDGRVRKTGKRHPTIGNRVVIYANATLLGGDTEIGDDCVIGAGVWLTESLPAGTMVLQVPPDQRRRHRRQSPPTSNQPSKQT